MPFFTGVANSLSIYKNLHTIHTMVLGSGEGGVRGGGSLLAGGK